jgi:ABC-type uncharacterized transport system involved in gliding motility auxiliary subunit
VIAAVPALIAIFLLGQGVLDRRAWRLDLTPERRYSLSDHAERILTALDTDVKVLAFLRSQDPRNTLIRDLLRQFSLRSPHVKVEAVDVNRSPSLAREYDVESSGALVVESAGAGASSRARRRTSSSPRSCR